MVEKQKLIAFCEALCASRIQELQAAMKEVQQAANAEEKSSMGDKYETSRAMSHLERDRLAQQLEGWLSHEKQLKRLVIEPMDKVANGAVVITQSDIYFIAIPLGNVSYHGQTIRVISPVSPAAKAMAGCQSGDSFILNGKQHKVKEIN